MFIWRPWLHTHAADAAALFHLGKETGFVAFLGNQERQRFGIVGFVETPVFFTACDLEKVFTPNPDNFRMFLLNYEFGLELVQLKNIFANKQACYADFTAALIFDHQLHTYALLGDHVMCEKLENAAQQPFELVKQSKQIFKSLVSDKEHAGRILEVQKHIAAGDIYQANVTRPLQLTENLNGPQSTLKLLQHNPVERAAYVHFAEVEIVSNSMETLLTYDPANKILQSFPIKGTVRRENGIEKLRQSQKDQAEHIMIVDLVRNDLGKVSKEGSVNVKSLMAIEAYYGVLHAISCIEGQLKTSLGEAVAALFPGGSITGAPKRRAMEILQNIEQTPRGCYTGSLGLLWPNGKLSLSILIRTLVRHCSDKWLLHTGGGIVADSQPEAEIAETWDKVKVFETLF